MKLSRKQIAVIAAALVLCVLGAWYLYFISTSYEFKLVKGEENSLWIGFQHYGFLLKNTGGYIGGEPKVMLTVTSGNDTETREIGLASKAEGKTFKFLDLEVYIKEPLVDGLRIIVRKW